ncbi:MAG: PilN domain-containing protein, partial [Cyanobacteria bacterium J06648_11]
MYLPEINFLAERGELDREVSASESTGGGSSGGLSTSGILLGGGAVLAIVVASCVAGTALFQYRIGQLKTEEKEVDTELAEAQAELAQLQQLQAELSEIQTRTQALKTFFDRVQPWSAILEEIRSRIPPQTWIQSVSTTDNTVRVDGQSSTFDQVNDFQLALLQSPLIADVAIVRAELDEGQESQDRIIEPAINYSLTIALEDKPVSEY